jgi:hypothetical protein
MVQKLLGASWQTKIPAVAAAVALLIGQVGTVIDSDPKTAPDTALIITQVLMLLAIFQARANTVTSEQVKEAAKR